MTRRDWMAVLLMVRAPAMVVLIIWIGLVALFVGALGIAD